MKKRMFMYSFIFTMLVLGVLISDEAFGQSAQLPAGLEEYEQTLRHEDIRPLLPDFLETFKNSGIQKDMSPRYVDSFLRNPIFLRKLVPGTDPQFIGLLYADEPFRTLFGDEQFYNVLKDSNKIDKLLKWFEELQEDERICEIPEPPTATILSIVSGNNQSGEVGKSLAQPFVVGVLDQDGKPLQVQQTAVTFRVTAGNGQLSTTRQNIDVYGQARTTLTLGSGAGRHTVSASVSGVGQATFNATAIAPRQEQETDMQSSTSESSLPPMYWIEGNTIYYRPTGGEKEIFLEPRGGVLTGGLAVDTAAGKVYWTEQTGAKTGRIRSVNLDDGTSVQTVKDEPHTPPLNIALDAKNGWLYWTNNFGKIQRFDVNRKRYDGNFSIEDLAAPKHVAFDVKTGKLYWTETDSTTGKDGIRVTDPEQQKAKPFVVKNLDRLGGIAVADDVVYWTEQTSGSGSVRYIHRNGLGSKRMLDAELRASLKEIIPGGIAVDAVGGKVYWTTSHGIRSAPLTGKTVVIGEEEPAGIALGGTAAAPGAPAAPSVSSVSPVVSVENTLLANYPNPFNPETWIPYQLSASADVSVSIYGVDGRLVRRLELGHQPAGVYRSRSRAAYWDGRNEFGERVASGLYFYTLTAGDFSATRKMLIRK